MGARYPFAFESLARADLRNHLRLPDGLSRGIATAHQDLQPLRQSVGSAIEFFRANHSLRMIACVKCMQYTIRGVPPLVDRALRVCARASGKSVNEAVVDAGLWR